MNPTAQFPREQSAEGEFERQEDAFRELVSTDGSSLYRAAAGRYHLYISLACPWASRTLIMRNLKGLQDVVGVTVVEGTITEASGTILAESVDTGVPQRDEHLRTADFFDAAKYPTITFKAKRIKKQPVFARHRLPDGRITIVGDFTMRGITKELRLPARLTGPAKDPLENIRIGLAAKAKLNRRDYRISFHQVLETGALLVGEEVELEINAEAIKETARGTKKP